MRCPKCSYEYFKERLKTLRFCSNCGLEIYQTLPNDKDYKYLIDECLDNVARWVNIPFGILKVWELNYEKMS